MSLKYFDWKNREIFIKKSSQPLHIYIPKDPFSPQAEYIYLDTRNLTLNSTNQLSLYYFNITSINASVHILIKPVDLELAYFVAVKFKTAPFYTEKRMI